MIQKNEIKPIHGAVRKKNPVQQVFLFYTDSQNKGCEQKLKKNTLESEQALTQIG